MDSKKQIQEVVDTFPSLDYLEEKKAFVGTLEVMEHDLYEVYIDITPWRTAFPKVYETGERIPRILDRHIYEEGSCCFTTPALADILLKTKVKTLLEFIVRIVIPFFQNNSYYEIHKEYIYGEYSHTEGILEGYQDVLKIKDSSKVIDLLVAYYLGFRLTHRHHCYCGSKYTLRKCKNGVHFRGYQKLKLIDKNRLLNNLIHMLSSIELKTT
ncbi:hypothetical protein [uncultured Dokdonia sp.]|uniref:hypothetical protein n=1 Tax=uncultured Dokdonia sp. TaxID=575653 RepID=UPI00262C1E03|nr:hypothetical protein [uncultured Dokdonia sp.]